MQRDRWGRCDAAAEHMVTKLRSIGSGRPMQSQSTRGPSANARVRRVLGPPSSLEAGEGGSLNVSAYPFLRYHFIALTFVF
jgi:hypothetical protein